jgi:hypothetical protein
VKLLLGLARAHTLGFESRRTQDHILLSHLGLQVPVFISTRNMVAQLYLRALGTLFVASYDSQGYGGVILTRLYTGVYISFYVIKKFLPSIYVPLYVFFYNC